MGDGSRWKFGEEKYGFAAERPIENASRSKMNSLLGDVSCGTLDIITLCMEARLLLVPVVLVATDGIIKIKVMRMHM